MSNHITNEFSIPTKQSPVAIILLIWKYFVNIIRQFWPALIAVFIGRKSTNVSDIILISVIVVAVLALFFAIAYYLRFSFKVQDDELFINKGVFKKSNLNIPFERIQTLNFEQGIIHQIFDVVKIEVDTAGSSKNEFTFNALEKSKAEQLRTMILQRKSELISDDEVIEDVSEINIEEAKDEIFRLELKDLFIIGLTQNHLRTLVLLFFFSLWGIGELEDAGLKLDFLNRESAEALINSGILIISGLALLLLFVTIIGTGVRTILRYFDFKMFRVSEGFKIKSGLINRKEYAALDHKIQQIKWINNPLKRIFRIHDLQLKQASSIEVTSKRSIKVPGIKFNKIKHVISFLLGDSIDHEHLKIYQIEKDFLMRNLLYFGFAPWLLIGILGWYFSESNYFLLVLLMIPYMVISIYVAYKKWRYSISDHILYTHHGIFENKNNILQLHKVQNVKILQTPYQWRRGLASVKIYTAAGSLDIPYVRLERAVKIKDYLLYKVELNHEKWY